MSVAVASPPRANGPSAREARAGQPRYARDADGDEQAELHAADRVRHASDRRGGAVADSSFHHFCDCNLDPAMGAPSFVTEPWGNAVAHDPVKRADADVYASNIAAWLVAG